MWNASFLRAHVVVALAGIECYQLGCIVRLTWNGHATDATSQKMTCAAPLFLQKG